MFLLVGCTANIENPIIENIDAPIEIKYEICDDQCTPETIIEIVEVEVPVIIEKEVIVYEEIEVPVVVETEVVVIQEVEVIKEVEVEVEVEKIVYVDQVVYVDVIKEIFIDNDGESWCQRQQVIAVILSLWDEMEFMSDNPNEIKYEYDEASGDLTYREYDENNNMVNEVVNNINEYMYGVCVQTND